MIPGPALFARFAFPPNALGYCGPADSLHLFEAATAGATDELAAVAPAFDGAFPYLQLIAGANRIEDALDARVVEAYWVGNDLLAQVDIADVGMSLDDRFRRRAGAGWDSLSAAVPAGAVPHHSFHVFGVYPWVGLLRSGRVDEPLQVLDRCRIRWGVVQAVESDRALISSQPITWDGTLIGLGDPADEWVSWADAGRSPLDAPAPGDVVAAHWDWMCDILDDHRLHELRRWTAHTLRLVNGVGRVGTVVG
jgi:hypothetical protein